MIFSDIQLCVRLNSFFLVVYLDVAEMNRNTVERKYSSQFPDHQPSLLSRSSTASLSQPARRRMDTTDQQAIAGMRSPDTTLTSWESSASIGSRTVEEKAEDELFDKIEDCLSDLMRDPSPHHLPCRVFQWPLPGDSSRMLNAVIIISPSIPEH